MLSIPWEKRQSSYEFVVVGSGYGGAITAARLAAALGAPHKLCILERGLEWDESKQFPSDVPGVLQNARSDLNPHGLYEFLTYRDISVIKGSGLGGTSLINANVAIVPPEEVFNLAGWPRTMRYREMLDYYKRAKEMLAAGPVPGIEELGKFKALDIRARQLGQRAEPLDVVVNFKVDGVNPHGAVQHPCVKCGDCVTGCNFRAKNTLDMNYLPEAARAGADIFTRTKVEWIEKLAGGGWRIHGQYVKGPDDSKGFKLDTRNVILAAGAINSTEILLRSERKGLSVSPQLGTRFSGNGDFFGLAYNGSERTNVLGYGKRAQKEGESSPPGPSIVGVVRYNAGAPLDQRITIEDFSFPSAYLTAAKALFAALRGDDTRVGDEEEQRRRILADFDPTAPYNPDGALNHSMLYLVMGQDDARGTMNFDAPWHERDGRMTIEWDQVGQQIVFTRMNEEIRRHARALSANFIANPTWNVFNTRHLITAHPLGGCPIGEDHQHGAVDEFGRVFASDGAVHEGLFVADGALIPSALGVNPFLTISALAERIAERKVRDLGGDHYPARAAAVAVGAVDPLEVIGWSEPALERMFRRSVTLPIEKIVNAGGPPQLDVASRTVRNDAYWKGFFPKGHILNALSSAIFTGFKKTFQKSKNKYTGITSDTDGRITAHNSLEEVTIGRKTGTLEPGRYILLRYLDPEWASFYDILKVINDDLIIGRVYLGEYPNGARVFTFSMTRRYGFAQMTVADHELLYGAGSVPRKEALNGVWRMDIVSNNNHLASAAKLAFDLKPDGRLESRYQLMGLMEGLVIPSFAQDHFQLSDFTPFHDEIRQVDPEFMVGRYITAVPELPSFLGSDLGIFHRQPGTNQFGFYYTLTPAGAALPTNTLLSPFLDVHLPDGISLSFDEEMTGWYVEGAADPPPVQPENPMTAGFQVKITARDINEFIEGAAHEASLKGTVRIGGASWNLDEQASRFRYLTVNEASGEAEMQYHLEWAGEGGERWLLEGRKFLKRGGAGGANAIGELLRDYTTLYARVWRTDAAGTSAQTGSAVLKFRTFEDLAAIGNLAGFLGSFTVTGTDDPLLQLRARMRFLAFTAQFVQREYDPLSPDLGRLDFDVRAEVLRGASTPDWFSTQSTPDLHAVLHDSAGLPLEKLINTREVRVDLPNRRIHRDLFWKGSFARDTVLGWEERVRNAGASEEAARQGRAFAGGAFWKRFDKVENGVATGQVVNYDLAWLPGDPDVREVEYPDDNRRYFRKGDKVLLLRYRNDPYRAVYDTIKIVGDDDAIGVMHLGEFPNGVEAAAFVLSRYSYPLENMSAEDHQMLFERADAAPVSPTGLEGTWEGSLILLPHPPDSLLAPARNAAFRMEAGAQARFRLGFGENWSGDLAPLTNEMRSVDADTVIGRWSAADLAPGLREALRGYVEPGRSEASFRYLLTRVKAGAATPAG